MDKLDVADHVVHSNVPRNLITVRFNSLLWERETTDSAGDSFVDVSVVDVDNCNLLLIATENAVFEGCAVAEGKEEVRKKRRNRIGGDIGGRLYKDLVVVASTQIAQIPRLGMLRSSHFSSHLNTESIDDPTSECRNGERPNNHVVASLNEIIEIKMHFN